MKKKWYLILLLLIFAVPSFVYANEGEQPNTAFMEVKVEGEKGKYTVEGKARPKEGFFYYTVEDGHNQFIHQTKVTTETKYPDWSNFKLEVEIPEEKLPENGSLILNLYELTKSGEFKNTFPVVLERFY